MRLHILFLAVALAFFAATAFAGADTVSAESDIWSIALPLVQSLAVMFGPLLAGWLAVQVSVLLGVQSAAKRQEIEIGLRNALHAAALNGLKVAVARLGLRVAAPGLAVDQALISDAVDYVLEKNPETVRKLGIGSKGLADIVLSKVPDVLAGHAPK